MPIRVEDFEGHPVRISCTPKLTLAMCLIAVLTPRADKRAFVSWAVFGRPEDRVLQKAQVAFVTALKP